MARQPEVSETSRTRGRPSVLGYYEGRREVVTATPRDADPARLYEQFALAALGDVADWVSVLDPQGVLVFSRCALAHEHSAPACRESVLTGGDPHVHASPLVVEESAAGSVVIARSASRPRFSDEELVAIHDVVTALGVDLERLRLRFESRQALRASQRVASQLHQLISASLLVGVLNDEAEIVLGLVRSARSVFDGDRAVIRVPHAKSPRAASWSTPRFPMSAPTPTSPGSPTAGSAPRCSTPSTAPAVSSRPCEDPVPPSAPRTVNSPCSSPNSRPRPSTPSS